jgi:hemerythrin-like metal-binding protein
MALLTWNDGYSMGVKTIDQQHSGLFGMVNDLHAAMMKGQGKAVIGPLLDRLVKYTQEHFAFEERAMEAAKYPNAKAHRAHHADLARQVTDYVARYKRGDSGLNIELLRFLSDWLSNHIQKEDKEYGPWLNSHGVH